MMRRFLGLVAALGALLAVRPAGAQTVKYLNQLGGAATIAGTNTLPVCQVSGGCGSGNPLVSATVAQLNTWFQSQLTPGVLPVTPPVYHTGAYTLAAGDVGVPQCLDGSSGASTFTLPAVGSTGFPGGAQFVVCDDDANVLTLSSTSALVGPATLGQNEWAVLTVDATHNNWRISKATPLGGGGLPESANTILAGPASGSASAPVFRPLAAADMPATAPSYKTGSYTLAASDLNNPVCLKGSSAASTFTLPAPGTAGFGAGAVYVVCDLDANNLTLATSGGTFLGLAANPLTQNTWATLTSDGTNWLAFER